MTKHVLLLDLRDDPELIAEYEAWHAPGKVPAKVVESMRRSGILGMKIYRSGNRLVMIMEVGPEFDPTEKEAADRASPEVQALERLMDSFQQKIPSAEPSQKWVPATRIFNLNEQG